MDGLTIRNGQSLLESGKTASERVAARFDNPMLAPEAGPKAGEDAVGGLAGATGPRGKSFAETLKEAVSTVNELQKDADVKMQELATGKTNDIPTVMMSAEKADIALRLMTQVRNKIIDAYQEVMKMQV
jgi:flagellar hook-basal body complex protein FliE